MNRDAFPPGGWQFYEPKTGWSPRDVLNYSFYQMAELIHNHRVANRIQSSYEQAQNDLEAYTRARFPELASVPSTTTNVQPRVSGCRTCGR
jgi:hypothetical protein